MDRISVDENGYVWVGGLKVCRLTNWGCVEFFDRDRIRASRRGSNFVYADTDQLMTVLNSTRQVVRDEQVQKEEDSTSQ